MRRAALLALCGVLSLAVPIRAQSMDRAPRTAHRVTVSVRGAFPSTEDTGILLGHGFSRDSAGRAHWAWFAPRVLDDLTAHAHTAGVRRGVVKGYRADCRTLERAYHHDGHRWAKWAVLYLGCD